MRNANSNCSYLSVDDEHDFILEFIDIARDSDKVIAVLCDYEYAEALADELLLGEGIDFTFVKRFIHEDEAKDLDFFVSVDPDGGVVVQSIEWFNDKHFNEIEVAFIAQENFDECTLNYLYKNDIEVVFVDYEDDCDEDYEDKSCCECDDCDCCEDDGAYSEYNDVTVTKAKDGTPIGFSIHWGNTGENSSKHSSYSFFSDDLDELKSVAKDMEVYL